MPLENELNDNPAPDQDAASDANPTLPELNSTNGFMIPPELPIIPLRGMVVFPQTMTPLLVGHARSVRLLDDAAGGNRLIGLVLSKDPDKEDPSPDDLHRIGTIGEVHRLFRSPDGTIRLLVQC